LYHTHITLINRVTGRIAQVLTANLPVLAEMPHKSHLVLAAAATILTTSRARPAAGMSSRGRGIAAPPGAEASAGGFGNSRRSASRGVGRGVGRGIGRGAPLPSAVESGRGLAPPPGLSGPATKQPPRKLPPAPSHATDSASPLDESVDNMCLVCAAPIEYAAVGPCQHPVCHRCALRMRLVVKEDTCVVCRANIKEVCPPSLSPPETSWMVFDLCETVFAMATGLSLTRCTTTHLQLLFPPLSSPDHHLAQRRNSI